MGVLSKTGGVIARSNFVATKQSQERN